MEAIKEQAADFLAKTKTTFKAEFIAHDLHFEGDTHRRDIYEVTLTREGKKPYSFRFGQSLRHSNSPWGKKTPPTPYDVLACLTKNEVGSFDDFCADFGYDTDSRKAEKIYFAVQKEADEVERLFSDVMDELIEIC